jgi:glucosamine-6-phosphate deaminase
MRTRIFPTPDAASSALAREVAHAIDANPRLVLGLPTGRTPIPFYRQLIARYRHRSLDCSGLTTFNLDEFLGMSGGDPRSYCTFMRRHLFDHINVPSRRVHFLNGLARNIEAECRRYEAAIRRAGGIDLQILGLGGNGHIGFNEPGDSLGARTHLVTLTAATRRANAALFGGRPRAVPRQALSMGMATILNARRIVLLANGAAKARAVARAIDGPLTTRVPASFLQLHPDVEVWLDRAAAAYLKSGDRLQA